MNDQKSIENKRLDWILCHLFLTQKAFKTVHFLNLIQNNTENRGHYQAIEAYRRDRSLNIQAKDTLETIFSFLIQSSLLILGTWNQFVFAININKIIYNLPK